MTPRSHRSQPATEAPVIGLSTTAESLAGRGIRAERASALARPYIDKVAQAGAMPLLLAPYDIDEHAADALLDLLDALVLTGGLDVDPSRYGRERHPQTRPASPQRDVFELTLARRALLRSMPILGICRGMQLLNVTFGGTLHQHLPEVLGHPVHKTSFESELVEGTAAFNVTLDPNSLVADWVGAPSTYGWSNHHQGIAQLGDGLIATGWAEDGLTVAIEMSAGPVVGVQWHPEVDPRSPVIERFIDAVRGSRHAAIVKDAV